MRKISLFISLILLFGCEKYVGTETSITPPSVAGEWKFTDYYVTKISEISPSDIISNDTICINSFINQSVVSGGRSVLMKQNYNSTAEDRRFIKNQRRTFFSLLHPNFPVLPHLHILSQSVLLNLLASP